MGNVRDDVVENACRREMFHVLICGEAHQPNRNTNRLNYGARASLFQPISNIFCKFAIILVRRDSACVARDGRVWL